MAASSNNNHINNLNMNNNNRSTPIAIKSTEPGQEDLYPAALQAIEDDNLEKMEVIFKLEQFNKSSLDNLLQKACERSKDIDIEENYVKNNPNRSNSSDELSMISICRSSRKNNEKLVQSLLKARCQAEQVGSDEFKKTPSLDTTIIMSTPTKPEIKSLEKKQNLKTPEMPVFKSKVNRQLKF